MDDVKTCEKIPMILEHKAGHVDNELLTNVCNSCDSDDCIKQKRNHICSNTNDSGTHITSNIKKYQQILRTSLQIQPVNQRTGQGSTAAACGRVASGSLPGLLLGSFRGFQKTLTGGSGKTRTTK